MERERGERERERGERERKRERKRERERERGEERERSSERERVGRDDSKRPPLTLYDPDVHLTAENAVSDIMSAHSSAIALLLEKKS